MAILGVTAGAALVAVVLFASARKPNGSASITFSAKEARVQASLYSGLPNPEWTLQTPQLSELLKMLSELPASKDREPQQRLGYSGLRLELIQTNGESVAFRIHDGGIWMEEDVAVAYADKGRALEQWLIATAPPDVRQLILRQFGN